jgi:hypothetical protein
MTFDSIKNDKNIETLLIIFIIAENFMKGFLYFVKMS